MTEQDYLHQQLDMMRDAYHAAAKPLIDRLIYLRSIERRSITIPLSVAQDLGLKPKVYDITDAEPPAPDTGFSLLS
jgi:hypothetical protein